MTSTTIVEKPWTTEMTVEQMKNRLDVLDVCFNGKLRRGMKRILIKQYSEIIDELNARHIEITKALEKRGLFMTTTVGD